MPPGKRAFPFHNHHVNEEMFFVLEGEGEVRLGEAVYPIRPGDVIACPAGGKETAHQIINTGTVELKYLAISTRLSPEIAEYPDSGKFGVLAEYPPGLDGQPRGFRFIGRETLTLGYMGGRVKAKLVQPIMTKDLIPSMRSTMKQRRQGRVRSYRTWTR